jgi:hypothetical protein
MYLTRGMGPMGKAGGWKNFLFGQTAKSQALRGFPKLAATKGLLGNWGLTGGYGSMMPTALGGITGLMGLGGLYTAHTDKKDEEDDLMKQWLADKAAADAYWAPRFEDAFADGGRIGYAEGKEVLPLIDMGGKEKDYRNEGGFVPLGREERADDVPARLSKNEFVFTADAVRAAGGGDIDRGAEVMENVMENLEKGGNVSEESQGLEGARNMFATSQRLEGVL